MYKILLSIFLFTSLSYAGLVNAISILVNDEPITLYDIDKTISDKNLSKQEAITYLIDELLYEQQLKQNNIKVDIFEVGSYMEKLAASNNMDVFTFKSLVRQKYGNLEVFEEDVKKNILRQKLIQKAVKSNLKIATNDDIKVYYENNQGKYTSSSSISAIEYSSENKRILQENIANPLVVSNLVQKQNITLDMSKLNPKLKYILNDTKENSFTPVFVSNKRYVSLLITKKSNTIITPLEEVKNKIFLEIMSQREKKALKEYFEKLKLTADIKIIR